jgi:hypothetical protein
VVSRPVLFTLSLSKGVQLKESNQVEGISHQ